LQALILSVHRLLHQFKLLQHVIVVNMPPRVESPSLHSCSSSASTCDIPSLHMELSSEGIIRHSKPLGIILDLDGTVIAESMNDNDDLRMTTDDSVFIRPGTIEFLQWCLDRGHSLAVWTAGHSSWAHYVSWKLCSALHPGHACRGGADCKATFDFVWSAERLHCRKRIPVSAHGAVDGCLWCESYRRQCDRCCCRSSSGTKNRDAPDRSQSSASHVFRCPCRFTKDLRKVWKRKLPSFTRERTILIENTPQQCIRNYGNAVYVPTYTGDAEAESRDPIFGRMKKLILQMEQMNDVRSVPRCSHHGMQGAHACFQQTWWYDDPPTLTGNTIYCLAVTEPGTTGVMPECMMGMGAAVCVETS